MITPRTAVASCFFWLSALPMQAQDGGGGYLQTVFPSVPRAIAAAQARHMVLARDFFGNFRFVTPELAALLQRQGFRQDGRGVLLGYMPGAFEQGVIFRASSPVLARGSYEVRIEPAQPDPAPVTGTDTGGTCGEGDDCE